MAEGLTTALEPLVKKGRLREALELLARAARGGAPRWEVFMWQGRLLEKAGRLDEAERAYRSAVSAGPPSAHLERDLARFLENRGKFRDAEARLRRSLRIAPDPSGETFLSLGRVCEKQGRLREAVAHLRRAVRAAPSSAVPRLELGRVLDKLGAAGSAGAARRQVSQAVRFVPDSAAAQFKLAELQERRGEDARARLSYRRALDLGAPPAEVRLRLGLLCERQGRLGEARTHLRRAAAEGVPTSRPCVEFVRALERLGLLDEALRVFRAGADREGEAVGAEWPERFSVLLCARRTLPAFAFAEEMLRRPYRLANPNVFLWPWFSSVSSRHSRRKAEFCAQELHRLGKVRAPRGLAHWLAYCRGVLCGVLGRKEEAAREHRALAALRPARYSCLHHPFVMNRLMNCDFSGTIRLCRAILKRSPRSWWFQCRLGEAHLALGDARRGLAVFARAGKDPDRYTRQVVWTWHGEVLLQLGDYRGALRKLEAALRLGASVWVYGWRGAARLMTGDRRQALRDLDRAVAANDQDLEAYVWRGETLRLMGRPRAALKDLDRAVRLDPGYDWAYVNRALVKHALGNSRGMAEDFTRIRPELRQAVCSRLGLPAGRGLEPRRMKAVLEEALRLAAGVRRPEPYAQAIWLARLRPPLPPFGP